VNYNDIISVHQKLPNSEENESNEIVNSDKMFKMLSEMKSSEFNDDIGPCEHYKVINKKIKKTIKREIKQKFMTKNI